LKSKCDFQCAFDDNVGATHVYIYQKIGKAAEKTGGGVVRALVSHKPWLWLWF
jgi:hypothetical protein